MKWDGTEFSESLKRQADFGLENCIGANECMLICPVNRLQINQNELDSVMVSGVWTDRVKTFVTECVQCGDCTLSCPAGVQRDVMMLFLKSQLPDIPSKWKSYYTIKGRRDKSTLINIYNVLLKAISGPLGKHIDKKDLKQNKLLFYFGCYIFSPSGSASSTLKLADRLNLDYEVLGGLKSCCGWPHYLSGQMGYAQQMLIHLGELIDQIKPEMIVSGCAECYAALQRLKKKTGAIWTPLTTPEWLLQYAAQLQWNKLDVSIAIHDSCHVTKKLAKPDPIRQLLSMMADPVEITETPENCLCCGYYNIHVNDDLSHDLHHKKLEQLSHTKAQGMAVECVTCWESFQKSFKSAQIPLWEIMVAAEKATRGDNQ